MKIQRTIVAMLLIAGLCVAVTGCNETTDAPEDAAKAAPKDHPAH